MTSSMNVRSGRFSSLLSSVSLVAAAAALTLTLAGCGGNSAEPKTPEGATAGATAGGAEGALPAGAPKAPGEAAVGDKTTCPISGEEFVVKADSPKQEYKGKTYYFCCAGCDKKFAQDPEKFLGAKH